MVIGILGGGQLGRMLALAGYELGLRFRFLDPSPKAPAGHVGDLVVGDYLDPAAVDRFAAGCEVITYEFENVPVEAVKKLAARLPVYPPVRALEVGQDRIAEKTLFASLGLEVPAFRAVGSSAEVRAAAREIGLPAVLKTRRMGYDGKGQAVIRTEVEMEAAWARIGEHPGGLILEQMVAFERELSVISVRSRSGEMRYYPLIENVHAGGILARSTAPAPRVSAALRARAESAARAVAAHLNYVGVLTLELFQVGERLLVNEMAPRVHNSGHWTIDGSVAGQFENHVRAVAGWPLGSTAMAAESVAMMNLVGHIPDRAAVLEVPGAHLHLYGKSPRPGRKVGHITIAGSTADVKAAEARLATIVQRS
ncbi:MAG: 5-(carboxyamino)imidazole ribonucleotide synthase [Phycisphaerales bacterium]|nr:5-(carboxyamino)imidazole ribonucleotide synthase [Phycisphaerales bacterium]